MDKAKGKWEIKQKVSEGQSRRASKKEACHMGCVVLYCVVLCCISGIETYIWIIASQ